MNLRCPRCKSNEIYFEESWFDDEGEEWYIWECKRCFFKIVELASDSMETEPDQED